MTARDYAASRAKNIAENKQKLHDLGILRPAATTKPPKPRAATRKRKELTAPERQSRRKRSEPPTLYTPVDQDAEKEAAALKAKEEVKQGWRLADGRWRGEGFGEVPGVPVGTVFGAGDYQRKGRTEMMDTGFFRPWVTPEWFNPNSPCFAIIVNNDNGTSTDHGNKIMYAGAGGRRRGQNRSAAQSFDQSWASATNKALRLNYLKKQPVRVVRGPKCQGGHGTANAGGGYRYDGLFTVVKAELQRVGPRKLLTAMFTLEQAAKVSS